MGDRLSPATVTGETVKDRKNNIENKIFFM
jgi:hypothetical protein